jgi:hypothetical protein
MADNDLPGAPGTAPPAPASEPAPAPRPSIREVAEAAWDDVQDAADASPENPDDAAGQSQRQRDNLGRFAPADQVAKPGEQSTDPAPKTIPAPNAQQPVDPALGSNQPPQHWPEADRQTFAKLDPAGVQFTQSLAPIFQDPVIAGSLQQAKVSPYDAIGQWASFHRRAMDPNPQVRVALLTELGQRMGLDPAALRQSQPGMANLSEEDLKDPAIRYFADHLSKQFSDVQALRGELHQMRQQEQQKVQAEVLKVTRGSVDSFADEKDDRGNLKHPHFDAVLPHLIELYRANPERTMQ